MKYLVPCLLTVAVLSGCAKKDESPATETTTPPPAEPTTTSAPPPASSSATASVQLMPTQGNTATGTLTAMSEGSAVVLNGSVQGLPPNGEFGFHIHEKGDCSAPDASSAGEHFNPTNAQHGNPAGESHHAGDMTNLKSDAQGNAQLDGQADGVTLGGGQPNDVAGRAVVIHAKADDYSTQPSGNSGARIACGVITPASPSSP
jgi:Cu-Zn family superoxide dismutase